MAVPFLVNDKLCYSTEEWLSFHALAALANLPNAANIYVLVFRTQRLALQRDELIYLCPGMCFYVT